MIRAKGDEESKGFQLKIGNKGVKDYGNDDDSD